MKMKFVLSRQVGSKLLTTLEKTMTEEELDRLLAMLQPGCDGTTLRFVKERFSKTGIVRLRGKVSEQQAIDPFESPLANDPRDW